MTTSGGDDGADDLVREFLAESEENLERLDRELLALERGTASPDAIAGMFRTLHSIKGACGFFGFARLEALAHAGEGLLARLRVRKLQPSPDVAAILLCVVDATRSRLASVATTGSDAGEGNDDALLARLAEITQRFRTIAPSSKPASVSPGPLISAASISIAPGANQAASVAETTRSSDVPARSEIAAPEANQAASVAETTHSSDVPASSETAVSEPALSDQGDAFEISTDGYVRLDVALLDRIMNLVGELVLARNEVLQHAARSTDHDLIATSQRLDVVTAELQSGVMKTRMQPVGLLWRKLPRLVRDLARDCGKQVRLETEGAATELDRTVLEAIKDPLIHMVRNAVDHGIESPIDRAAAGKRVEGVLSLRAYHESGVVNIEVSDDGMGISPQRVRDRAVQRGLITQAQGQQMSEREIVNLVFAPGFSTADRVTSVSGRGVGMDVVKTNIEKIGGSIDLYSRVGQGIRVRVKIPLTLAIVPALIVSCAKQRYAIPQLSLVELVRLEGERARTAIETLFDVRVFGLRGDVLPIVYLRDVLHPGPLGRSHAPDETAGEALEIVIVQADDKRFGIVVEGVADMQEIVVKPLGRLLEGASVFAGATILGDGRVALILDVLGLAQRANVVSELTGVSERGLAIAAALPQAERRDLQSMLVLALPDGGRVAMSLAQVARLEEFPLDRVERAGELEVIQYRGEILPLIRIGEALTERRRVPRVRRPEDGTRAQTTSLQVVVHCDEKNRTTGLVVDRVIDVVDEAVTIQSVGVRPGVLGTMTLQGRVTELLDIPSLLRTRDGARRAASGSVAGRMTESP